MTYLKITFALAGTSMLVACGTPEPLPAFGSELEKKCYLQARDALTDPRAKLRRTNDGSFVVTTSDQGFLDSVSRSPVFDACMTGSSGDPNRLSDGGSLTFTLKEQSIWDSLSDDEKADAFAFIRGGGTLTEWAAANG